MMNGRAIKSTKLFIFERSCLSPRLGIVLMLAFLKVLVFFQVKFYPLPDSKTVVIWFSSLFIISEKFENKVINFWCLANDWHRIRKEEKKRKSVFPSLQTCDGISEANVPADCFSMVGLALGLSFFHSPFQDLLSKNILWGPRGSQDSVFG